MSNDLKKGFYKNFIKQNVYILKQPVFDHEIQAKRIKLVFNCQSQMPILNRFGSF